MLEFIDSDLYFVQDKNYFINPFLQVGSGSVEKSTGSGSGGPKIAGSDRIRILIPDFENDNWCSAVNEKLGLVQQRRKAAENKLANRMSKMFV